MLLFYILRIAVATTSFLNILFDCFPDLLEHYELTKDDNDNYEIEPLQLRYLDKRGADLKLLKCVELALANNTRVEINLYDNTEYREYMEGEEYIPKSITQSVDFTFGDIHFFNMYIEELTSKFYGSNHISSFQPLRRSPNKNDSYTEIRKPTILF